MFDIGFWEIAMVGVIALLVVGPERLPKVARVAGLWIGKGRRFMSSVKGEIDRELKADELKRIMAEQAKVNDLYEIGEQAKEGLSKVANTLNQPAVYRPLTDNAADAPAVAPVRVRTTEAKPSTDKPDESDRQA